MRHFATISVLLFTAYVNCAPSIFCDDVVYRTPSGEIFVIDIEAESSFSEVISKINSDIEIQRSANWINPEETLVRNEYFLDFMERPKAEGKKAISPKGNMRNFSATLLESEKKKISQVVETLGNASLVTIAKEKSSLEKAGKAVDHVHPLKFLAFIFSTERLKAAIHNLNGRSWVWDKFFKGLKMGLEEEASHNNLLPHIKKFSSSLKIDSKALYLNAEQQRWKEFVNILFKEIPRSENSGRYDM
ncbi:MAG: hypothetical protein H0T62_11880 [Parachlamydiaceae bacterium]|nr:hypothetical protein [Parachlamydiaceae bacterium]